MTRYLFITKTAWDEPPRLRHQLAKLLSDEGHEVLFFEKPRYFWQGRPTPRRLEEKIILLQYCELLHHRLRLTNVLHGINALFVKSSIRGVLKAHRVGKEDVIVNFNYDYYFLRKVFPSNLIITIINDDFISGALLKYTKPLLYALQGTCTASDRVLTVSVPLQRQLIPYCRAELFLPWADRPYQRPEKNVERDVLLFWGYINVKCDFRFLNHLAEELEQHRPEYRLMFVGPVENSVAEEVSTFRARSNVEFLAPAPLEELPMQRVFGALIPYRERQPDLDVIMLPNKALQLLARGVPLLITGMPHFIEAPFVIRIDKESPITQVDLCMRRFWDLQPSIEKFIVGNGSDARLTQLLSPGADQCVA